jgi:hypothetical protein
MFVDTIEAAIGGTKAHARLNDLAQDLWKTWGAGTITDAEAERLGALLETQRGKIRLLDTTAARAPHVPRQIGVSVFPLKRRASYSPDRAASMTRRRRLAASGPMPPALAARFTTGELAALRIVADEVRERGSCSLTMGEIAARAGVSTCTARNGIRGAARDGLVTVEERRRHMAPNLSNVVRVISREWRTWIERTPKLRGGGSKKFESTDKDYSKPSIFKHFPRKVAFRKEPERSRPTFEVEEAAMGTGK